jgi:hypothetical protein
MKYTIIILTSTVVLAILGALCGWGLCDYTTFVRAEMSSDLRIIIPLIAFAAMPAGFAIIGLIAGSIAVVLGCRFSSGRFDSASSVQHS